MGKQKIAVIDYGSGNLRSAAKAFEHAMRTNEIDGTVSVTDKTDDILNADRIVLPGQGAFGDCIAGLRAVPGMVEALEEKVLKRGTPFFGICVGMQLLADRGLEFGEHRGLGWIGGDVVRLTPADAALKIPHMGWNAVSAPSGAPHPLLQGVIEKQGTNSPDFYFVHSFMFQCRDEKNVIGWCDYGGRFAAIVGRDNIVGTQFHSEKSQDAGLELIGAFLRWNP